MCCWRRSTVAGAADRWLVCGVLRHAAAHLRAAHARPLGAKCRDARSWLTGRVVDTYTNILTVKLFARAEDEDDAMCAARSRRIPARFQRMLRLQPLFALFALDAQRLPGRRDGGDGDLAVAQGDGAGAGGGDGAAADLADRQHRRLGRLPGHVDCSRMSAWCRRACATIAQPLGHARCAGREELNRHATAKCFRGGELRRTAAASA
jgi:hypothetical protein